MFLFIGIVFVYTILSPGGFIARQILASKIKRAFVLGNLAKPMSF